MAKKDAAAKKSQAAKTVGRNIEYSIDNDILTIKIDTTAKPEPSGSGKTLIVATTQGNKWMGDMIVGINAYRYPDKKTK